MEVSNRKKGTVYQDIVKQLLEDIESCRFKENKKIPSERELMERFGVSRMTVRKAIDRLIADGVLFRISGRGAFVSPRVFHRGPHVKSFSLVMQEQGFTASSRVIRFERIDPPENVRVALHLEPGEKAYYLVRIRLGGDIPMAYECAYLPVSRLGDLEQFDFANDSLYRIFTEELGQKFQNLREEISAVRVNGEIARALYKKPQGICLLVNGTTYNQYQEPIEFCFSYYHNEHYKYCNINNTFL